MRGRLLGTVIDKKMKEGKVEEFWDNGKKRKKYNLNKKRKKHGPYEYCDGEGRLKPYAFYPYGSKYNYTNITDNYHIHGLAAIINGNPIIHEMENFGYMEVRRYGILVHMKLMGTN